MLSQKHLNQVMRRRVNKMIICTDSLLKDSDKIIEYPSQVISNDTNFPFFDTDQKNPQKKRPLLSHNYRAVTALSAIKLFALSLFVMKSWETPREH